MTDTCGVFELEGGRYISYDRSCGFLTEVEFEYSEEGNIVVLDIRYTPEGNKND